VAAGWGISWVINGITAFLFYGDIYGDVTGAGHPGQGAWSIFILPAGALLLTWLLKYRAAFLRSLGITIAIGAGAPLGAESPAMIFTGGLAAWLGKLFRCTAAESRLLFIAGVCSALAGLFGAPAAAVFLALEVLLPEWTAAAVLPVVVAAATAGAGSYLLRGAAPVYSMPEGPPPGEAALLAYLAIGLLMGLWSALAVNLSAWVSKWLGKLTAASRWYLLTAAAVTGIAAYIFPAVAGTGNGYINDLLHAHVTLSLLFALGIVKLVAWLLFSGAYKTGTGFTPLLVTGGAMALLIGVVIQLLFPSVIIPSGMIVLTGMGAMLCGTSRALLTSIVFSLEITHNGQAALPLCLACIAAYGISMGLLKQRKAADHFALQ
jgi:H+/Cl- antiporter ClcA